MLKILTLFGTRPEAIKMSILCKGLSKHPLINHKICVTGQHKEMLYQILDFFEITPDFDLKIMTPQQTLSEITSKILIGASKVMEEFEPNLVLVHGDTTTCFAGSLAAFYKKIKVGHIEAGLRTGNLMAPFPEEANRILTDSLTDVYFTPTIKNFENLLRENVKKDKIVLTGNTVIDALLFTKEKVKSFSSDVSQEVVSIFNNNQKVLLVTGHRRENFGEGFEQICNALKELSLLIPDLKILYPVHLNPQVQEPVQRILNECRNITLTTPFDYPDFILAMTKSWAILTDSGGVQEEGPSLGKPVLVMRDVTERPEAVETGTVKLVGANKFTIVRGIAELWNDKSLYSEMSKAHNPYGNGNSSEIIIKEIVKRFL